MNKEEIFKPNPFLAKINQEKNISLGTLLAIMSAKLFLAETSTNKHLGEDAYYKGMAQAISNLIKELFSIQDVDGLLKEFEKYTYTWRLTDGK